MTVVLVLAWNVLYPLHSASGVGHPSCRWRHSECAKLNFLLHLRDLSEKIALERRNSRPGPTQRRLLRDGANGRPWRAVQWLIGVAIERDEACAIANHSLEPALANSAPAHLLQSFWLLSEHWACAAELSKPVFFNTTFCE